MSMRPDDETRGFSGIGSLVTDIAGFEAELGKSRAAEQPTTPEPRQEPRQIFEGKPRQSGGSSGKWWAIGVAVVVALIWLANSKNEPVHSLSNASSVDTSNPSPSDAFTEEQMPPVGSGLTLNRAQIRYCLSEEIRMSAWQEKMNEYSNSSVDAFNAAVNNYNSRCSDYRYRKRLLESVRKEVEANRGSLVTSGAARALENP